MERLQGVILVLFRGQRVDASNLVKRQRAGVEQERGPGICECRVALLDAGQEDAATAAGQNRVGIKGDGLFNHLKRFLILTEPISAAALFCNPSNERVNFQGLLKVRQRTRHVVILFGQAAGDPARLIRRLPGESLVEIALGARPVTGQGTRLGTQKIDTCQNLVAAQGPRKVIDRLLVFPQALLCPGAADVRVHQARLQAEDLVKIVRRLAVIAQPAGAPVRD